MQRIYHIKQFLSFVLKERFHPRVDAHGPQLKFDRKNNKLWYGLERFGEDSVRFTGNKKNNDIII